ncbi:MAG TPA: DUF1697 domain-containing protein [Thermomicrobiales bacterium]|nr:DUF1697 domain-containing protein [Thermomicrobiales bacterium]
MPSKSDAPQRYVAFLRAINVGGHTVKMDRLRALFEELGLSNVETFIASGNVIFETSEDEARLQAQISDHLHTSLGYQAEAFLRSTSELAQIAAHQPFPESEYTENGATLHIAFMSAPATDAAERAIMALRSPKDDFHINGRELYWLIRGKTSESMLKGPELGKALGSPTTVRNSNTIRRLVAKYPPA